MSLSIPAWWQKCHHVSHHLTLCLLPVVCVPDLSMCYSWTKPHTVFKGHILVHRKKNYLLWSRRFPKPQINWLIDWVTKIPIYCTSIYYYIYCLFTSCDKHKLTVVLTFWPEIHRSSSLSFHPLAEHYVSCKNQVGRWSHLVHLYSTFLANQR